MAKDSTDLKQAMFQVSDGVIGAAVLVFIGVLAGNWLDAQFHSSPLMVILLSMLGGTLGLVRLVKKAMQIGVATNTPDTKQAISATPSSTEVPEAEQIATKHNHDDAQDNP